MRPTCIRFAPLLNPYVGPRPATRWPIRQRYPSNNVSSLQTRRAGRGDTQYRLLVRQFSIEHDVASKSPKQHKQPRAAWKRIGLAIGLILTSKLIWDASRWLQTKQEDAASSRTTFQSYKLIDKEPVSSTASIFHLQHVANSSQNIIAEGLKQGILNLEFKQPQIQVVRAYTPLPNTEPMSALRFLIRQEPNGEVSSWLHRLPVGSHIEMRGPNYEFLIPPETRRIVFLAGGTGVAPALQAAHSLLQQSKTAPTDEDTRGNDKQIHILWAIRRREDCVGGVSDLQNPSLITRIWRAVTIQDAASSSPASSSGGNTFIAHQGLIVRELETLKANYPDQVSVSYFVDEESTFITEDAVRRTLKAIAPHPSSRDPSAVSASSDRDENNTARRRSSVPDPQILVSGPDGFIAALAGPKVWLQGRQEQGPVGGMLQKVLLEQRTKDNHDLGTVGVYKI